MLVVVAAVTLTTGCAAKRQIEATPQPGVITKVAKGDCVPKVDKTKDTVCQQVGDGPWGCQHLKAEIACYEVKKAP